MKGLSRGLFVTLIASPFLLAQVAELKALKSPFELVRNAQVSEVKEVSFLFQDLDLISSKDGYVTFSLSALTGIQADITLSPSTSILLSASSLKEEQVAQIFLLKGQVDIQVRNLVGKSGLVLRTSCLCADLPLDSHVSAAAFTSRGFLLIPMKGSIRVKQFGIRDSGVVVTRGMVVELLESKLFTRSVSNMTLSGYTDAWLKMNAPKETVRPERLIRLLLTQQAMFARAMTRLRLAGEDVWGVWEEEEGKGEIGTPSSVDQGIRMVQGPLLSAYPYVIPLLEILFALEVFPALNEEQRELKVSAEWTAGEFAQQWPTFSQRLKKDIWKYFYWLKLYKIRNQGDFLGDTLPEQF